MGNYLDYGMRLMSGKIGDGGKRLFLTAEEFIAIVKKFGAIILFYPLV